MKHHAPKIKDKTNTLIIQVEDMNSRINEGIVIIILGIIALLLGIFYPNIIKPVFSILLFNRLIFLLVGGFIIYIGLDRVLGNETVTIDTELKSVFIERRGIKKNSKKIEEISFSQIKEIKIEANSGDETILSWDVYMLTEEDSILIYKAKTSRSEAEKIAKEIRNMTGKRIVPQ